MNKELHRDCVILVLLTLTFFNVFDESLGYHLRWRSLSLITLGVSLVGRDSGIGWRTSMVAMQICIMLVIFSHKILPTREGSMLWFSLAALHSGFYFGRHLKQI